MEVLGYSERGMINSLIYEIKNSNNAVSLINKFLSLIIFPFKDIDFDYCNVSVLIDHSLSDFGDADLVIISDSNVIFFEAKVKTYNNSNWKIQKEFDNFKKWILKEKESSSNLFFQIYEKLRLFRELKKNNFDNLIEGVKFPKCSSKEKRKIGKNGVVLKAVEKIKDNKNNAFFVSIVPDRLKNIEYFYKNVFNSYKPPEDFQSWDISNYGFLSWHSIHKFCKDNNMFDTLSNFEWNDNQIYKK